MINNNSIKPAVNQLFPDIIQIDTKPVTNLAENKMIHFNYLRFINISKGLTMIIYILYTIIIQFFLQLPFLHRKSQYYERFPYA